MQDLRKNGAPGGLEDGRIVRVRRRREQNRGGIGAARSASRRIATRITKIGAIGPIRATDPPRIPRNRRDAVFDRGRKLTLPIQWREAILFGQIVSI
ncbi:hypothetical protein [Prosthecomicrobium hirschii]|uniref:hypothetical protein n=1 Tax=Prosthecodimorpha hirschii TaxID=665126 RepID=UPI00128FCB3A|nr:hypothetical protein [Prosthecomicrobium hirschii]